MRASSLLFPPEGRREARTAIQILTPRILRFHDVWIPYQFAGEMAEWLKATVC